MYSWRVPSRGELLQELYTNAAVFVLPSSLEGLALTLLEAASYRLPVMASDIPPNREVIGSDGPEDVSSRVATSSARPALAATLGASTSAREGAAGWATASIREYDWEVVTDATEEVYETVLNR